MSVGCKLSDWNVSSYCITISNTSIIMDCFKQSHIDITELLSFPDRWIGKVVEVCGWIKTVRMSGKKDQLLNFIELADGSCIQHLQIISDMKGLPDDKKTYFDDLFIKAKTGTSLRMKGLIVKSPAKGQAIEMQTHEYQVLGEVMDPGSYPISKNELSLDYLRTVPHLRTRTDTFIAINTIKSILLVSLREYFRSIKFHEVQVPLITDNECEAGANPFQLTTLMPNGKITDMPLQDDKQLINFKKDFFEKQVFLTVSGQLHLECLVLGGLNKAWCMTTAFRAEPSHTPLHGAEFLMAELEFCFCSLKENMDVNEGCIKYCIQRILEQCPNELQFLQQKFTPDLINTLKKYITKPFVRTTHEECVKLMLADIAAGKVKIDPTKPADGDICTFREAPKYDDDLSKDHEKYITHVLYDNVPVFCCAYPASVKAFYMPIINKGAPIERVSNFDLLMPKLGEICGGSQRESDYNALLASMTSKGIKADTLQFYLDLRKYGTVPHGGSGIGIDRLLMIITGVFNIRDMIPFPRTCGTCYY